MNNENVSDVREMVENRLAKVLARAKQAHEYIQDPINHHHEEGVLEMIEGTVMGEQKFLEKLLEKLD